MRNLFLALGFLLLGFIPLSAQDFEAIEAYLKDKVDTTEAGPGMAVGILIDGEIVYEKYIGMANLEFMIPISEQTKFNIASNAKQFTALATLKLISEGRLALNDDIRKYLPELLPNIEDPITVLNLIHHSSGMRSYGNMIGLIDKPWWKDYGLDNEEVYQLLCQNQDLNFKPGTEYSYSNSGYILLTRIIEVITEQDFPEYTAEMFQELGMENTLYPGNYRKPITQRAAPYAKWGRGNYWKHFHSVNDLYGDGFLFTTLRDQLKWEQTLQYLAEAPEWVQQGQSKAYRSPEKDYGCGVEFRQYDGKEVMRHSGSTGAYGAQFLRFPKEKVAIVVMGNSTAINYYRTAYDLADLLFNIPQKEEKEDLMPEVSAQETPITQWVGDYVRPEGQLIQFLEKDGNLLWTMHQQEDLIFTRSYGDVFVTESIPGLKYHFEMIDGQAQFTGYYPGYKPRIHPGMEAAPVYKAAALAKQKGTFKSPELEVGFTFLPSSETAFTIVLDEEEYEGKILRSDIWVVDDFTMHPEWNSVGQLSALLVDYNGDKNIRFDRQ